MQIPIGAEEQLRGIIDIIARKAFTFEGINGVDVKEVPVPAELKEQLETTRAEMVERVAEVRRKYCDACRVWPQTC